MAQGIVAVRLHPHSPAGGPGWLDEVPVDGMCL